MKTLVLYDSVYQNTEKIAQAIAGAFPAADVKVIKASSVSQADLSGVKLLIVGSPTQGGRATQALQIFFNAIPGKGLTDISVAAFDTRMTGEKNGWGLRTLVKVLGWAAGRIAETLKSKGGTVIVPAEGFVVEGREVP